MNDTEHVHPGLWKPDVSPNFTEVEQLIEDARAYSLGDGMNEQDIYGLIQQELSVMEMQDVIPAIVEMLISRKTIRNLEEQNARFQKELSRIVDRAMVIKNEIDILSAHECVLEVGLDGTILAVNDFMIERSWFSRGELIGENMRIMSSWRHSKEFWDNFWSTIQDGRAWVGDICNKRKDGSDIWLWTHIIPKHDTKGKVVSFQVVRQDVSASYEALNQKIDHLTRLPNHKKCLEDFSIDAHRSLVMLHINNMFKINNTYSRETGDKVIRKIAKMLENFAQENGVHVYRFEWPNFGIVFEEGVSEEYIRAQYEKLADLKVFDNTKRIELSFSAWAVLDEPNITILLKHGDLALRESKQMRKCVVFNDKNHLTEGDEDFFKMRNRTREAFKEGLFEIHFQEIVRNSSRKSDSKISEPRKFECLIRMPDPENKGKYIAPGKFLSVIEEDGKNQALTTYVIKKTCEFMLEHENVHCSINLTEDNLQTTGRARSMYEQIRGHGIDPSRITFEILEGIKNLDDNILENIRVLKEYGFEIAIDDFGSGYSNLSRIPEFKANSLKIDMSLTRWIDTNNENRCIVQAIIVLAHGLGMTVVAEGVETENEQLVLKSLWADFSQGYLFSRPSPTI